MVSGTLEVVVLRRPHKKVLRLIGPIDVGLSCVRGSLLNERLERECLIILNRNPEWKFYGSHPLLNSLRKYCSNMGNNRRKLLRQHGRNCLSPFIFN